VSSEATRAYIKGIVAMVPLTLHPENVPEEYKADYKSYTENAEVSLVIPASFLLSLKATY
jgi:versiconal hemiacetal acetate esterase